jgi:hypothetical protein
MKLLDEIVDLLSTQDGSITDALLKTKVLLHKIGHQELIAWVNNELNGYPDKDKLPEYRVLPAQVLVNASNMAYIVTSHPVPLGHLTEKQKDIYQTARMDQSLAVLEQLVSKEGSLRAPIPMEANGLIGKGLGNGYLVEQAWCEIQQSSVMGIFVQVRSRLLDFVLGLKVELGDADSDTEVREKSDSIDAHRIFDNAIFGDNTTIIVGNNNKQNIKNIKQVGNFNALAEELRKHGVNEVDITDLKTCLAEDKDTTEVSEQKLGPNVKSWLQKMLSKAIEASWQVELGIASSVLSTALQNYYGW